MFQSLNRLIDQRPMLPLSRYAILSIGNGPGWLSVAITPGSSSLEEDMVPTDLDFYSIDSPLLLLEG